MIFGRAGTTRPMEKRNFQRLSTLPAGVDGRHRKHNNNNKNNNNNNSRRRTTAPSIGRQNSVPKRARSAAAGGNRGNFPDSCFGSEMSASHNRTHDPRTTRPKFYWPFTRPYCVLLGFSTFFNQLLSFFLQPFT